MVWLSLLRSRARRNPKVKLNITVAPVRRIVGTLFSLKYHTKHLHKALETLIPFLTEVERTVLFFEAVDFYSKDASGTILECGPTLECIMKSLSLSSVAEAIRIISKDTNKVRGLAENYKYCSYGDKHFSNLVFLFTSRHSAPESIKYFMSHPGRSTKA